MKINPHLHFNGNCEEAFNLYSEVLGGKIASLFRFTGSPAEGQVPPEMGNKILHATMTIGDQTLFGGDTPPGYYSTPQGFSVSISVADTSEGERIFNALSKGGTVKMPFAKTFWSPGFGMLTDRFGTPWMINSESQ